MSAFENWKLLSAWAVFLITYAALAIGYVPRFLDTQIMPPRQ